MNNVEGPRENSRRSRSPPGPQRTACQAALIPSIYANANEGSERHDEQEHPAASLDPAVLAERFQMLATKSQSVVREFLMNRPDVAHIGMGDPAQIGQAFFELTTKLMADPSPLVRAQIDLWQQTGDLWAQTISSRPTPKCFQRRSRRAVRTF
jgi:hypothetical protein